MRIESASRNRKAAMLLPATNEESIVSILLNDKATMLAEFPDFGDRSWVNGFVTDAYVTTKIQSLPELPFPNFDNADSRSQQIIKSIDMEWKQPCVYLCFWLNVSTTPTPQATTSSPGNWIYVGKIALVHQYGYPERKYRFSDFLTDDISAALAEGERLGVSYQWPERLFYHTLRNVVYRDDPSGLKISTFTEELPPTALSYSVDGFRVISGEELPIEPIVTVNGRILTCVFDHELQMLPATIRAIVRERGSTQKLTATDLVTLKCTWKQEIISLQPDFTPTPVIVQGTVNQVTRNRDTRTFNASTTRQNALSSQPTRVLGRITNNGATNQIFYKFGSDVTVSGGQIPSGTNPSSVNGGYSGILAVNGGFMDVPTGYTGVVSVVTNAGVSSCISDETYTVAA